MSGTLLAGIRAELLRLRRWPTTWVLIGTWLGLNLAFGYVLNYVVYRDQVSAMGQRVSEDAPAAVLLAQMMPANTPAVVVQGVPLFGGAIALIFGALAVGNGYGWGTWKTVFTAAPRRLTALGGTWGALFVVLIGLVLATLLLDLLAALSVATAESQPLGWPGVADTARAAGAALLILSMWAAAGVLLGTLTRGPALAVGLGLVWTLVVENLLRGVSRMLGPLETLTNLLPGTAAGSLAGALTADPLDTPGVLTAIDGPTAALLLVGYLVPFLATATLLTLRRDLS